MFSMQQTDLTTRQRQVLDYIEAQIRQHGFPPSLREIGQELGIRSTNGVSDHLRALERKGYISRDVRKPRSLALLRAEEPLPDNIVRLPVLGAVAAGALSEAIAQSEDSVVIDASLLGRSRYPTFALRIRGDSMIEAGIFDGDFVFVRKQLEAARGQIVVAMVGDEATCKYFFPERDYIRLEPANAAMAPILVPRQEWRSTRLIGVVAGVYRKLGR